MSKQKLALILLFYCFVEDINKKAYLKILDGKKQFCLIRQIFF